MNLFDGVVVGVSMLEIALSNKGSFSSLRTLRVLRILKLVRSWRSLHKFLTTVYITVLSLGAWGPAPSALPSLCSYVQTPPRVRARVRARVRLGLDQGYPNSNLAKVRAKPYS